MIANMLLNFGADFRIVMPSNGYSALHYACETGDFETVEALIKAGADIFLQNKEKCTPLMISEKKKDNSEQHLKIFNFFQKMLD